MKTRPGVSGSEKILRFFIENPNSIDTPRGVSAWTGIALAETRKCLETLAKKGALKAYRTSSTVGYSLGENQKARRFARALSKQGRSD